MSFQNINLNTLLRLCALPENLLIGELRNDLRNERDSLQGIESTARHFHYPWWYVAKLHVIGEADLRAETPVLIDANAYRKNLYPRLTEAFLRWFDELRRSINEPFAFTEERVHNRFSVPELQLTVKIDNLLTLRVGDSLRRCIYPYFSDSPPLSEKWARVGLWFMDQAFPNIPLSDVEILDVLRSRSFNAAYVALAGNEEAIFRAKYLDMLELWRSLRPDYGLVA